MESNFCADMVDCWADMIDSRYKGKSLYIISHKR